MATKIERIAGENRVVCVRRETLRWLKRQSNRYTRRAWRMLGEDAPKKLSMCGCLA